MNKSWFKAAIIGTAMLVGYVSYVITKKPDGVIEQAAEAVLHSEGVDVDLSPE
jgi:hypothetical protein